MHGIYSHHPASLKLDPRVNRCDPESEILPWLALRDREASFLDHL